ncbi:dTDP-4-amino-4,6-dideoxygalactose transaminase [Roseateles chitinivorans]|uniref:dTDP-4-amino-4,6-dideoxygalactose transaminase n=1 Tax=Roseateles chitinivorans TaxID=2917965 RepID=A0A2G9CFD0_9BURK|nr:dTDP-4-amino-4,6-dideoxygalactose transaminase [Roseateles chitinivorans]PIM55156.1 dTDP-4-amino-4,6-dideoxygalactose transaminase [Roseateles chitinivorans]
MTTIPFNKPYLHGRELVYIAQAVASGKISGDGLFTKKCHSFFEERYGFSKALMTTSCTDALEMCALLLDIKEGDEVIVPSFTFVSSANAFVLRGAKLVFADSEADNPNIDAGQLEALITPRTRAIVVVHYAGVACDMDRIDEIARRHGVTVIEDAAQAIDAFYKGRPLGSLGALAAFSFHETKNVIAGEGGLLAINDPAYGGRAEIIREKGTNRSAFFRGEVDKYGWVDVGSSFLPSDIISAYLFAQLENLDTIQQRRRAIWQRYWDQLASALPEYGIALPTIPDYATNNAHMFYLVCRDLEQRTALIAALKAKGIHAVFHYLSLHDSPYFQEKHDGRPLPHSDRFSNCLLRLPMFYELNDADVDRVCGAVLAHLATS